MIFNLDLVHRGIQKKNMRVIIDYIIIKVMTSIAHTIFWIMRNLQNANTFKQ